MIAWNSGAYDTTRDRLLIWGGGHKDYSGNELYAFNVNSLSWARIWGPSANIPGSGTWEAYPDGNPGARHTYDGQTYIPSVDKFFVSNGSLSWTGYGGSGTWLFNSANSTWQRASDTPEEDLSPTAVYDPVTQHIFHQTNHIFSEYDPVANTYTQRGTIDAGRYTNPTGAIDPVRRLFVTVGSGKVSVWDLNTWQYSQPATTGGSSVVNNSAPGFKYDPVRHTFIGWVGGATVYELDPSTWAWTARSPAPTNTVIPTNAPSQGTFSRFQYIPSKNAYIAVNSVDEDVYVYKLSAGTPGPPPPLPSFDFSLSNAGSQAVVKGQSVSNAITASLISGTAQSVSFSASGLPDGTTASFPPASCSPTCSSTVTLTTAASTPAGSSTITITGTAGSLSRTTTFIFTVSAAPPSPPPRSPSSPSVLA